MTNDGSFPMIIESTLQTRDTWDSMKQNYQVELSLLPKLSDCNKCLEENK